METDSETGMPFAFKSRLVYFPSQGSGGVVNWGVAQQMRLIWLVQMIGDECIVEGDDPETCDRQDVMQVVHIYDDDWTLTGLSISEEHGADVAIVYEDPANDTDLAADDQLWLAGWMLNNTFLRGTDSNNDGVRDVRVDNLAANFSSWHDAGSGPLYLEVESFLGEFEHSDLAYRVTMTDTVTLLDTAFAGYETATKPTFLYVSESTNRSVSLGGMSHSSNAFTADFNPSTVVPITSAFLSWKPYENVAGNWVNADIEVYLDGLNEYLGKNVFVETAVSTPAESEQLTGKRVWAQLFYASLYQGLSSVVAANNETVTDTAAPDIENLHTPNWPSASYNGAAVVSFQFFEIFAKVALATSSAAPKIFRLPDLLWTQLSRLDPGASPSQAIRAFDNASGFSFFSFAVSTLMTVLLITAVVAAYLVIDGLISGNNGQVKTGLIILNVLTIISALVNLLVIVRVVLLIGKLTSLGLSALQLINQLTSLLKGTVVFAVIGFVFSVILAWGVFLYQLIQGFGGNKIARNVALSVAISGTIVAVIFLLINIAIFLLIGAALTLAVVGMVLLLLFAIVEAILFLAGEKTLTERLTEVIADGLYDVDFIVANFNSDERLDFNLKGIELQDESLGISVDNGFYATFAITNTINFRKQANDDEARRTAVSYHVQPSETDQHATLSGNSMHGDWVSLPGRALQYTTTVTGETAVSFSDSSTGLNQPIRNLYLTEAYALPYKGCWLGIDSACNWEYIKGSTHIDVGSELLFDIFPATIAEFANLQGWSDDFPTQNDQDNDGVLNEDVGGADPNDTDSD
ncbi:MAG: hypothetical protein KDE56_24130, partial [Anaerolineales bacterium]|nr:hypothetical protein [Anaerolineales bacterium]